MQAEFTYPSWLLDLDPVERVSIMTFVGAFRRVDAIELAFLCHPLMGLSGVFNLILKVVTFRWHKSRNFIDTYGNAGTEGT